MRALTTAFPNLQRSTLSVLTACSVALLFSLGSNAQSGGWELRMSAAKQCMATNDLDGAEREWKAALTAAEQSSAIEPGLVTCLVGLSFVYDRRGNVSESERLYELAMRNMEGLVGPTSTRFADWLPDLAFLYDSHGKPEKAEVLFKRAFLIKKNAYGPNDVRVAEVLEQYAKFLRRTGRQSEAADLEQRARTIRQKISS